MSDHTLPSPIVPQDSSSDVAADIQDELAFHIECLTSAGMERGLSPADARAAAEARFGSIDTIRKACLRLAWKERIMESLFSRRNHAILTISLFVALMVVVGMFVLISIQRQAMAAQARDQAQRAEAQARHATEMLVKTFTSVDPIEQNNQQTVKEILATAIGHLESAELDDESRQAILDAINQARAELESSSTSSDESL